MVTLSYARKEVNYRKSMLEYPVANDYAYDSSLGSYDNIKVLIFIGTYL